MRTILAAAIIGALLIAPRFAKAECWGVATIASRHFDGRERNERNLGLGGECDVAKDTRLLAGFYENSSYRTSAYVGANWLPLSLGPVRFGFMGGLGTGYREGLQPIPIVAPLIALEYKGFGVNLPIIPSMFGKKGVAGLQFKGEF